LRSAFHFGATVANYVRASGALFADDGKVNAIECTDALTGDKYQLRERHFVSTVGPWTDLLGEQLFKEWKRILRPSKGVHLTFPKQRFQLHDAVVMGAEDRIVFAIPRHDMVIVGTTDTDYSGDPANVRTDEQDVTYLLGVIERFFPGEFITRKDIVGCYAGVRPLIDDGAHSEGKTSREHLIWSDPRGITFVAGGKYTTYRNMAEQTVERILNTFSIAERVQYGHSQTLQPLNPLASEELWQRARKEHVQWAKDWMLPEAVTQLLAERHGLEGEKLIRAALPWREKCADPWEWLWCAEAIHAVDQTMCLSLTDFYFRRTHLVLERPDHGRPFVAAVVAAMGDRLNWDSQRRANEINALQKQQAWDLSVTISG
jgi:glycerol-3-phosphate dehydrogenase